jgi:hypothetical protein
MKTRPKGLVIHPNRGSPAERSMAGGATEAEG